MSNWHCPLPLKLIPTVDSMSFEHIPEGFTGLPVGCHPGSFGAQRKHHIHEGVDLYCPEGTVVNAVEPGVVVAVIPFTGENAVPPSPWWHDTWAVLVEGPSGVVVYGEITPSVKVDDLMMAGWTIGHVKQVLKEDKGRPQSMLHLELHRDGTRDAKEWVDEKPESLQDPTPFLLEAT
jgi:hypothetical protein